MESDDPIGQGEGRSEFLRRSLEQFEAPLVRYAWSLTGDLETARDVVQDTFLRLWEQPEGSVEHHLAPWLYKVCRNRALDVQNRTRRMVPLTELELDHHSASDPSPAESAAQKDSSGRLDAWLEELPLNQREVVRLKFQHQLSYREIAAVTSLSVTNVGFLLHTALKTLRHRFQALESSSSAGH